MSEVGTFSFGGVSGPGTVRRLIINADDFGYHSARNLAVVELLESGLLTSTTVLLNQPGSALALDYIRRSGRRVFGLHLNLSEGHALSSNRALAASAGPKWARGVTVAATAPFYYREIAAQFARAQEHFQPTHLDGHFHVHTRPIFWAPVASNMRRHGVRNIRRYFTYLTRESNQHMVKRLAKRAFDVYMLRLRKLRTTDFFFEIQYFMNHHALLMRMLPESCSVEIETHPDLGVHPNHDYRALKSSEFASLISGFQLISYADL